MARPRVFVSSTYYDLKYIRGGLEAFIKQIGYDPILFEKGDIPFHHDSLLEQSCLQEIDTADMLVLIIGGRYGSMSKEDRELLEKDPERFFGKIRSVTQKEYEKAREKDIPIFAFVDTQVLAEYSTYKANKENPTINYAFVDNVKIYELIDDIYAQRRNNFLREFSKLEDLTSWLRDQWAGLFSDFLKQRINLTRFRNIEEQIRDMRQLVESLRTYNEAILRSVDEKGSKAIISQQHRTLEQSRVAKFMRESMIDFIFNTEFQPGKRPSRSAMYDAFLKSSNLQDFLQKLKFSEEKIKEFLSNHETYAVKDYEKLSETYKTSEPPEDE
ncbi:hypothetical protein AYJ54_08675 [Bradyrhizobium centrolobii]|uniref:DUF4062 domain-containing protein n=1 Tax=Bradyrhizobium centrolobii TaxID=1505087 RepID=A0A176YW80_9BRAD|nr:DUF4062 domain-containing protein [Bradyrhizobium centrolobii]OAF10997.1 hypothetical protein AYJ54_08675 [Bradyrhizobium centrolobii]